MQWGTNKYRTGKETFYKINIFYVHRECRFTSKLVQKSIRTRSFRKKRFYLLILMMKTPNFDSKSHTPSKFGENVRRSAKMCEFRKNDRKCNEKKCEKNIYYFFQNLKSCKLKVSTLQKQRFGTPRGWGKSQRDSL